MPEVLTKPQAVAMFQLGEFGNTLRQWGSPSEAWKAGYRGKVAVRYKSPKGGGGPCKYNIPIREASDVISNFILDGWDPKHFYVNEMGPDDRLTLQGEYCTDPRWGSYLLYSTVPKAMREALAISRNHHLGHGARLILRSKMTLHSYEDFEFLVENFPEHVIEFSCYSCLLGSLPRRNTIFWEVRKY